MGSELIALAGDRGTDGNGLAEKVERLWNCRSVRRVPRRFRARWDIEVEPCGCDVYIACIQLVRAWRMRFARVRRILLSTVPLGRLDYLLGIALCALLVAALFPFAAADEVGWPAKSALIFGGGYAVFLTLRRLVDLGVANSGLAFLFLYGYSVAAGGLGRALGAWGAVAPVALALFLFLSPTTAGRVPAQDQPDSVG